MPSGNDENDPTQLILDQFRREVFEEGIVHEGDTVGTDNETLL